jgi:hypothetical protein
VITWTCCPGRRVRAFARLNATHEPEHPAKVNYAPLMTKSTFGKVDHLDLLSWAPRERRSISSRFDTSNACVRTRHQISCARWIGKPIDGQMTANRRTYDTKKHVKFGLSVWQRTHQSELSPRERRSIFSRMVHPRKALRTLNQKSFLKDFVNF